MATTNRVVDSSLFFSFFFFLAQRAELFKQQILKNFEAELADKKRSLLLSTRSLVLSNRFLLLSNRSLLLSNRMEEARRKQDTAKDDIQNQRRALSQELGSKKPRVDGEEEGGGGGISALVEEGGEEE